MRGDRRGFRFGRGRTRLGRLGLGGDLLALDLFSWLSEISENLETTAS
jgi:hypothetical protein